MNREIKRAIFLLLTPVFISSCNTKEKEHISIDSRMEMMDTDRAFSKASEKEGMKNASMQWIDDKGVLLRPSSLPLVGGNAIDYISQGTDSTYTLTWEPSGGAVGQAGDLGYTYGIYSLKPKNQDTVYYGTYVRVWKRQANGKWKFTLETGNEGIEE